MEDNLLKTCLYDKHVALGAQMSPFGGFIMPIQYTTITDEHNAVRHRAGMFDVSHMGEIFVSGPDAEKFVNHIFSNNIAGIPDGKILYGICLGILTGLFRMFGGSAEGVSYAIIISNILVPLIENVTLPKPFGKGGEK